MHQVSFMELNMCYLFLGVVCRTNC